MPDDPSPTAGKPGEESASPQSGRKRITCEVCGSTLAASGDALELSAKAKKMRDLGDDNTKLTDRVNDLMRENSELREKLGKPPDKPADKPEGYQGEERRKRQIRHWGRDRRKAA